MNHSTITVLLAEDDLGIRNPICAMLSDHGYKVIVASTDQELLEAAESAETWIIDVRLPSGAYEGILAVAELNNRKVMPQNPVIFISVDSEASAKEKLEALAESGVRYIWLEKPFEIELLLVHLHRQS